MTASAARAILHTDVANRTEQRFGSRAADRDQAQSSRVTTPDGVALTVCDTGSRSADHTVVFLHGFCLNRTSWARQTDYLVRRYGQSVRVIAYDHRGHGQSAGAPMSTYRIDQLADDLACVLAALHVSGRVTLVGHSMGAMTALAYLGRPACQRPIDPDGLVLIAGAAGKLGQRGLGRLLATPATTAMHALVEHAPQQAVRALVWPLRSALDRWRRHVHDAPLASITAAALSTTAVSTAAGFLPSLRTFDRHATLAAIRARTIIISGGLDPLTPPAHAYELAAAIDGAEHVHLPRAGHMLPQQAPAVINDAIRRVIATTKRANVNASRSDAPHAAAIS
jgi:pimeloyl-ACP methyl ester carboxylesterase